MPNKKKFVDLQLPTHHEFQQRLEAALTRAKVRPALIREIVESEPEYKVAAGRVDSVWKQEQERFELVIDGWASGEASVGGRYYFRFRSSEADFLSEAKRAQSDNLNLTFGCYIMKRTSPSEPYFVNEIRYYVVSR